MYSPLLVWGIPYNTMTKSNNNKGNARPKTRKNKSQKSQRSTTQRGGSAAGTVSRLGGVVSTPTAVGAYIPQTGHKITDLGGGKLRVTGKELLGGTSGAAGTAGAIRGLYELNPACWQHSRLALIARTYEKYRFNTAKLSYMPRAGTNWVGSVALVVETDPNEALPVLLAAGAPQQFSNSQFAAMGPVWAPLSVTYRREKDDAKLYYSSPSSTTDVRETSQAKVMLWSDWGDTNIGYVWLEYEIDFYYPELEVSNVIAGHGNQFSFNTYNFNMGNTPGAILAADAAGLGTDQVYEIILANDQPTWQNIATSSMNKISTFTWEAGKKLYATIDDNLKFVFFRTLEAAAVAAHDMALCAISTYAITNVTTGLWVRRIRSRVQ